MNGERSEVYFNLHKHCLSMRELKRGARVEHVTAVILDHVNFVVQPAGRERVRREGRKNVHAFVRGVPHWSLGFPAGDRSAKDMAAWIAGLTDGKRRITYNPHKYETFVYVDNGDAVLFADTVLIFGRQIIQLA